MGTSARRIWFAVIELVVVCMIPAGAQQSMSANWNAVGRALGKAGQMQPGGVYRIGLPRTDLRVDVEKVRVKPTFALGSYAAFKQIGSQAMVMGDLVLLDKEVNPVMTRLIQGGFVITGVHDHLINVSPHVMYMHYAGRGDAVRMAAALRNALQASKTPLTPSAPGPAPRVTGIDTAQIERILGHTGSALAGGVFQVNVPRAETITIMGVEAVPAMGVVTSINFQPTGRGRAAVTGDFVMLANEVNRVIRALRTNGIEVMALHNHALDDSPRLFYMHFWGNDDALKLARGLRAALDQTNSVRPTI